MELSAVLDGRYRIEERLVESATGVVYRARDLQLDCEVAVKVVPAALLAKPATLERYRRDLASAARLRHANLVPLLRVGEGHGTHYTVMELVVGESLRSGLGLTMRARQVVHIVRQLLDALREGHHAGLVHGALGPDTIWLARNTSGRELPRLAGFGATALEPVVDEASAPALLEFEGTRDFRAPEQTRGEAIDCRTDLFALGVLTYALLCGVTPFDAADDPTNPRHSQPMSKRAPWIHVDPLLEAFTHWLMQRAPALRPTSASEAAHVLDLIARDRHAAAIKLGVIDNQQTTRLEVIAAVPAAPARAPSETGNTGYEVIASAPRKAVTRAPLIGAAAAIAFVLIASFHARTLAASARPAAVGGSRAMDVSTVGTIVHHIAVGVEVETLAQTGVAPELVARYESLQLYEFLDTERNRVFIGGVLEELNREGRSYSDASEP